jgi:hypothetical protein
MCRKLSVTARSIALTGLERETANGLCSLDDTDDEPLSTLSRRQSHTK